MPFPNFHSARLIDPQRFERFATQKDQGGDGVDFILGIRADDGSEIQAIRFDRTKFTVAEAKKWLVDHDFKAILFEEATGEDEMQETGKDLGAFVKAEAGRRGLTFAEVARRGGDSPSAVAMVARGEVQKPNDNCVRKLAKGLGVSFERLRALRDRGIQEAGYQAGEDAEAPKSARGFTVGEEFDELDKRGKKLSQDESNYVIPSPDAAKACGACRFYLRNPDGSEIGLCQVVDGPIAWFATSDAYIGAAEEARFVFEHAAEEMAEAVTEMGHESTGTHDILGALHDKGAAYRAEREKLRQTSPQKLS